MPSHRPFQLLPLTDGLTCLTIPRLCKKKTRRGGFSLGGLAGQAHAHVVELPPVVAEIDLLSVRHLDQELGHRN